MASRQRGELLTLPRERPLAGPRGWKPAGWWLSAQPLSSLNCDARLCAEPLGSTLDGKTAVLKRDPTYHSAELSMLVAFPIIHFDAGEDAGAPRLRGDTKSKAQRQDRKLGRPERLP